LKIALLTISFAPKHQENKKILPTAINMLLLLTPDCN